jgi:hypothetical protein
MKRLSIALLGALSALAVTRTVHAESGPLPKGTFVLGAERLTGIIHDDVNVGSGNNEVSRGVTVVDFLGASQNSAYQAPRIAFDGTIIDGLTLGGSFTIVNVSADSGTVFGGTQGTEFLIAPRVGYAYMFSDIVGIWPRGGFSYWHFSTGTENGNTSFSEHAFAFDVDVPLVIRPMPNFGITVGPILDVTIGGSATQSSPAGDVSQDLSVVQFGLTAGLIFIF